MHDETKKKRRMNSTDQLRRVSLALSRLVRCSSSRRWPRGETVGEQLGSWRAPGRVGGLPSRSGVALRPRETPPKREIPTVHHWFPLTQENACARSTSLVHGGRKPLLPPVCSPHPFHFSASSLLLGQAGWLEVKMRMVSEDSILFA